jgi:hypothetical protein
LKLQTAFAGGPGANCKGRRWKIPEAQCVRYPITPARARL